MPFWTIFWLIVPAVLYLTISVVFYRRTADQDERDPKSGGDER